MPLLNYDSASTEHTLFYAQKIIDFFGESVRSNGCLTQIPITLFNEADHHLDKVEKFTEAINNQNKHNHNNNTFVNDPISAAIRRAIGNDCLDCRPTMPTVNFSGMKGQASLDAKAFIDSIKGAFGNGPSINASLPSLAFLFGSFCIPDLIKLIALLLASVIRINFSLDFTKFSFMALLTAILSRLLGSLLSFSGASISFSLSPIMCILDALVELNDSLTPKKNVNLGLSISQLGVEVSDRFTPEKAEEIESAEVIKAKLAGKKATSIFLGQEIRAKSISVKNFNKIEKIRNKVKTVLPEQKDRDQLKETVQDMQDIVNSALSDMESAISEIFQIGLAIQCESERATSKISDEIGKVLKYIAIINLLRSVIKKKTRNLAINVVASRGQVSIANDTKFSFADIAEVVGDATGTLTAIAKTESGNLGILTKVDPKNNLNQPLTMYGCNLNEFVKETHMDRIIEDAKTFAENNLVGKGNDPTYFSDDYITVADSDDFLPFDIKTDDVLLEISEILKFLNIKNPYVVDNTPQTIYDNPQNKVPELAASVTHTGQTISISSKIDNILGDIGNIRI
jgi:hypothetical protein